jgi:hemolysin III
MVRVNHTSIIEEIFNAITHGVGVILGVIGLIFLLNLSMKSGSVLKNMAFSIFGIAVTIAYLSSTLYHSFCFTGAKKIFKIIDHSSIFLLIAGTYTPFTLLALKGQHGLAIFLLVWIFAVLGIIMKAIYIHRFKNFSLALYLFMSWMIIFEIKPLLRSLPIEAVFLLGLGGLFYTFGITFYLFKKLPFHHAIWHIFVL